MKNVLVEINKKWIRKIINVLDKVIKETSFKEIIALIVITPLIAIISILGVVITAYHIQNNLTVTIINILFIISGYFLLFVFFISAIILIVYDIVNNHNEKAQKITDKYNIIYVLSGILSETFAILAISPLNLWNFINLNPTISMIIIALPSPLISYLIVIKVNKLIKWIIQGYTDALGLDENKNFDTKAKLVSMIISIFITSIASIIGIIAALYKFGSSISNFIK